MQLRFGLLGLSRYTLLLTKWADVSQDLGYISPTIREPVTFGTSIRTANITVKSENPHIRL